jgi:predicted nucleic acid-binding protein
MAERLGLTYDTGVLVALERGDRAAWAWHKAAVRARRVPTVPAVAVAEAWRDARQARLGAALAGCRVDPLDERQARAAGAALGRAGSAQTIDACILASAAGRGDAVLTADPDDLGALAPHLGDVVVIGLTP